MQRTRRSFLTAFGQRMWPHNLRLSCLGNKFQAPRGVPRTQLRANRWPGSRRVILGHGGGLTCDEGSSSRSSWVRRSGPPSRPSTHSKECQPPLGSGRNGMSSGNLGSRLRCRHALLGGRHFGEPRLFARQRLLPFLAIGILAQPAGGEIVSALLSEAL